MEMDISGQTLFKLVDEIHKRQMKIVWIIHGTIQAQLLGMV